MAAELVQIEDTRQMLDLLVLDDIYFLELSVARTDNSDDEDLDAGPRLDHEIFSRHEPTAMSVRLRTVVEAKDASYQIDVVTDYQSTVAFEAPDAVRRDFIERVALMAMWPYIRVAVSDLAARMRTEAITLGLFKVGDIQLGEVTETDPYEAVPATPGH
jgi:hypothetical protein